jgi:beta-xylosidase
VLVGLLAPRIGVQSAAGAALQPPLRYANPMRNGLTGKPLSCPDPSVIKVHRGQWNYFLFCTSDNARDAFPIWMSEDLVHCRQAVRLLGRAAPADLGVRSVSRRADRRP